MTTLEYSHNIFPTRDKNYSGSVIGSVNDEVIFGGSSFDSKDAQKAIAVIPFFKNDEKTMYVLDLFGHRRRLEEGLRKQNLKFDSNWKPVTK